MDVLYEQLRLLEEELHIVEEKYRRFAIDECGFDEESVTDKINQARLSPQKNKRLRCIYEAYKALMKAKLQWTLSTGPKRSHKTLVKKTE